MQIKSLSKGRFHPLWLRENALVTRIFLENLTDKHIIPEGGILYQQGQPVEQLTLVFSGKISLGYSAENGRRFQLGTIECDEQLFGEMEFFTGYPCQLDIMAEEPLSVAMCNSDQLEKILIENPKLAIFFASAIALDYQDTLDIFLHRMLYPIAHNVAYDLYRQYQNKLPMDGFTKNYLEAERFGTTDRVYRRAVKELIDTGLVMRGNHGLEIKDLAGLKTFLGNDIDE